MHITEKCNNEAMLRSVLNLSIIKQPSNLLQCRTAHKCTGYAFVLCGSTFIYFIWLNSLSVYQYMYLPGFFNYFFHTLVFSFVYCMKIEKSVCGEGYIDKNTCSLYLHFSNTCITVYPLIFCDDLIFAFYVILQITIY